MAVLVACLWTAGAQKPAKESSHAYALLEKVAVECRDFKTGEWTAGPLCKDTGRPLSFSFGTDAFVSCSVEVLSTEMLGHLSGVVALNQTWQCRVPMSPAGQDFVPLVLQLWGVAEPGTDHMHVDNHMYFIFHAEGGRIMGAAAYPIRDRYQFAKVGSQIGFNGMVRWFSGSSFQPLGPGAMRFSPPPAPLSEGCAGGSVVVSCAATAGATFAVAALIYQQRLKPAIIRRCLKQR